MAGSRVARRARPTGELELELPLPGLYNVYNALAAIAAGLALGRRAASGSRAAPASRCAPSSAGSRRSTSAGKPVSILLIKNPAGANEVLRTLRLEAGERRARPLDRAQRPDRRRPRRLLDLGRRLRAARRTACAGSICAGTRAPEMALRLKYAGWPRGRDRGRSSRSRPRSTGRVARRPGPALRPPHLHGPARAAHAARRPRPGDGVLAMSRGADAAPMARSGSDVEFGAYGADLPLWERARRERRRRARCSSSARAPAGSRCTWRGRGHRRDRASSAIPTWPAALERRAAERGRRRSTIVARPRLARRPAAAAAARARDRADAAAPAARRRDDAAARCLARARRAACAPGGTRRAGDGRRVHAARAPAPPRPRSCPTCARSTAGSTRACRSGSQVGDRALDRAPAARARLARRRASSARSTTRSSIGSTPTTLEREAARRPGFGPIGRRADQPEPTTTSTRSSSCWERRMSRDSELRAARALSGADEHLRRPRQHRSSCSGAASGAGSAFALRGRRARRAASTRPPTT